MQILRLARSDPDGSRNPLAQGVWVGVDEDFGSGFAWLGTMRLKSRSPSGVRRAREFRTRSISPGALRRLANKQLGVGAFSRSELLSAPGFHL